jgi:hypothetical protein
VHNAKHGIITPKALANFSPGFERSENPGVGIKKRALNPEESVGLTRLNCCLANQ